MKPYMMYIKWVLVVSGVLVGLKALTGTDFLMMLGGLQMAAEVVIGVCGVLLGYHLLTMKKK